MPSDALIEREAYQTERVYPRGRGGCCVVIPEGPGRANASASCEDPGTSLVVGLPLPTLSEWTPQVFAETPDVRWAGSSTLRRLFHEHEEGGSGSGPQEGNLLRPAGPRALPQPRG